MKKTLMNEVIILRVGAKEINIFNLDFLGELESLKVKRVSKNSPENNLLKVSHFLLLKTHRFEKNKLTSSVLSVVPTVQPLVSYEVESGLP